MSDNLRITEEHLLLFAAASLDFNPLHRSETYARTTSFGERVVYGVLGVLASLARVEPPAGKFIAKVSVDFRSALLLGIEYAIRIEPRGGDVVVADLIDGQTILVRTRLWFADGVPRKATFPDRAVAPRRSARFLADGELTLGLRFEGEYGPPEKAYLDLLRFIGLDRNKTGDGPIIALLCSSYLTGMELPGERAAYVGLEAEFLPGAREGADYFPDRLASAGRAFRSYSVKVRIDLRQGTVCARRSNLNCSPAAISGSSPGASVSHFNRSRENCFSDWG